MQEKFKDQFWGGHFSDKFKTMLSYAEMLKMANRAQEAEKWKAKAGELRYGKYPQLPPR